MKAHNANVDARGWFGGAPARPPIEWNEPREFEPGCFTVESVDRTIGGDPTVELTLWDDGEIGGRFYLSPGYSLSDLAEGERRLREAASR